MDEGVLKAQLDEACRRLGVEYERNHKLTGEVERLKRLLRKLVEEPTPPPEDIAKPAQSSESRLRVQKLLDDIMACSVYSKSVDRLSEALAEGDKRRNSDVPFLLEMLERTRCGCYALDCRKHGAYAASDHERVDALLAEFR